MRTCKQEELGHRKIERSKLLQRDVIQNGTIVQRKKQKMEELGE